MITVNFKYLEVKPGSRVLDIGCGSGRHTAAVHDLGKSFVVGADPNQNDLQQAHSRLRLHEKMGSGKGGSWSLSAADVLQLPFDASCFDIVICSEVLEHVHNDQRALSELMRVLKPSGNLVVSVPRRWPELICWALSPTYRNTPGGHLRIYHSERLITLVQSTGLKHRHTHYAHSLHTPYWWLKCLLGVNRDNLWPIQRYHRFLTWDLMTRPKLTHTLDRLLNTVMGKSIVLYFSKAP